MDDKGNPVYMYDFSGYGIEYNDYPDTVYIDGVLYNSGDKPLMYCKQYYRGDKYQFTLVRK